MKKEEVHLILCIFIGLGICLLFAFLEQNVQRQKLTARAMENVAMEKVSMENISENDGCGTTEIKKIALTFDDDVIIGLSQEISYKEAVSMI